MEMNQDESLKCLNLSKERFSQGDFEGALRMGIKAKRMFDTPETTEWLEKVKSAQTQNNSTTSPEGTTTKEDKADSSIFRQRKNVQETSSSKAATSDALYTPEQVKEVKDFVKRDKNDYYKVLGIEKTATLDEIKKSYKKLALKFHPDKNQAPGADEAFKIIAVAFSVLGDEEKRRNFDRYGAGAANSGGGGGFPSHFAGPGASFSFGGAEDISPEDLFNMFFQAAFAQQRPGQDGNPFSGGPFGGGGVHFGGPGQFFFSTNLHNPTAGFQRRPRPAAAQQTQRRTPETETEEVLRKFAQFIPLIIVFVLSIISSWMFPADAPQTNSQRTEHLFSLSPSSSHRFPRSTKLKQVPYFTTSTFQKYFDKLKETDTSSRLFRELAAYENIIEGNFLKELRQSCDREERQLAQLLKKAKKEQVEEIKNSFKLNSCDKFKQYS